MRVSGDGSVELAHAFGGINHQQRNVGGFKMFARHDHGKFFRHQMSLAFAANAGSIDKAKALAVALDDFVDRIARGAGNGRDDGAVRTGETGSAAWTCPRWDGR